MTSRSKASSPAKSPCVDHVDQEVRNNPCSSFLRPVDEAFKLFGPQAASRPRDAVKRRWKVPTAEHQKSRSRRGFCSSQESSSQPPCSPESPPWPPPAWMRSARSRPWPKQLLSAGRFTSFSLSLQRGASLSLSQERHLQPVKGGGLFRFPPPSTGDGYGQRPQVGASAPPGSPCCVLRCPPGRS